MARLRAMVTTIALKDDAPRRLRRGGEDAPWRRMLPGLGTALGGDDDCVGGRDTLVSQPIAREAGLPADYRQWRRDGFSRLDDWVGVWGRRSLPQ